MLILHIGSPKTGTTALQSFMSKNEDALRAQGINYMKAGRAGPAHNQISMATIRGDADAMRKSLAEEYLSQPDMIHFASSETLFRFAMARKLGNVFDPIFKGQTRVIAYLRRQDSYVESLYKQHMKKGRLEFTKDDFVKEQTPKAGYNAILSHYARHFGGDDCITVRPYHRKVLKNNNIIEDFCDLINVPDMSKMESIQLDANPSFSVEMSELLGILGAQDGTKARNIARILFDQKPEGVFGSYDAFNARDREYILTTLAADREKFITRFVEDAGAFFHPKPGEFDTPFDEVADMRATLERKNKAVEAFIGAYEALHAEEATPPAPVAAPAETEKADDEAADTTSTTELPEGHLVVSADALPPTWFEEIYPGGTRPGFYHKVGAYAASFVDRGPEKLVVSFDNLHNAGDKRIRREPWAQKLCADHGWSHLGIYAQAPTWFRDMELIQFMEKLAKDGFFTRFETSGFAGTSMGAFGALTFSRLSPGAEVVAFSPQTTLDTDKVPWEHRFAKGRAADWTLPYSDAADGTAEAQNIYLIYDPFDDNDRKQAKRLSGDNITTLRAPGLGHKSALVINRMGHLKMVMEQGLNGTLNPADFYQAIRDRRAIFLYRKTMEGYLKKQGREHRIPGFTRAFRMAKRRAARAAQ
jgi:hypothetical protein